MCIRDSLKILYRNKLIHSNVNDFLEKIEPEDVVKDCLLYTSSDGIAYLLLHLFQLMGQDFHVAADLLVGYPGIYLGLSLIHIYADNGRCFVTKSLPVKE